MSYNESMKKWLLSFIYLCLCVGGYAISAPFHATLSAGEFEANYDVQYAVAPNGTTIVTQNITLTNKLTNLYPQKYSIVIDSEKITNVIAYDARGIITPVITQKDGKTQIVLTFNDRVVGLGRSLTFTLRFENGDIAQRNGQIWEINIPGIAKDADIARYAVTLSVPQSFGPNAYMSPMPASDGRWNKEQMQSGGISAAYGNEQVFELTLRYAVQNSRITPGLSEIALPPDTAFQRVTIQSLLPKPKTVLRDLDGNWLAQYDLLPSQLIDIVAHVIVAVRLTPYEDYKDHLENPDEYTKPLQYWETMDKQIIDKASTYRSPRQVYDFVVETLSYDYERVNQNPVRKGAVAALKSPGNSICMEFTDLFIAVARSAGIPAREVIGYAHTTNARLRPLSLVSDVLHSWPEYYDAEREIWIPVDPTWANTTGGVNYFDKLDFNHIVFAIHGRSSDYPYPAGFYRKPGAVGKDVDVTFARTVPAPVEAKLDVSIDFPTSVTSGNPANGTVVVRNMHGVRIPSATVSISSSPKDVAFTQTENDIPPFAQLSYPFRIDLTDYFARGTGSITANAGGTSVTHTYTITPLAYRFVFPIASALWGGSIVVWLLIRSRKIRRKP